MRVFHSGCSIAKGKTTKQTYVDAMSCDTNDASDGDLVKKAELYGVNTKMWRAVGWGVAVLIAIWVCGADVCHRKPKSNRAKFKAKL